MHFSNSLSNFIGLICLLQFHEVRSIIQSPLKDRYDGYGEEWIFMPDGNEKPQVAILKGQEPESRSILDDQAIHFLLFTRSGPENGTALYVNDTEALKKSDFSPSRKTKFITHGWKSSSTGKGLTDMKTAYINHGDYNVFLVDWEPLASSTFYLGPMRNTGRVGSEAGRFIDYLVEETGLKTEDVHFIGHSLGAHVAGNTGASVRSGKLGRVTGLDPALPGFHILAAATGRLDSTDADFVDVIHSCGGILGWLQPIGDADFYPNGGVAVQPGCCCVAEITEACSHGRSYAYFTESITSGLGLRATKCDTWEHFSEGSCEENDAVYMGEHIERSAKGTYYLKTRSEPPYAYTSTKKITEDCEEPGGWSIDADGSRICGTNEI
ncbi:pancreatic lipase-related protein 2-like [Venturia canescens]|uniref:pancreatic lipase-related protein 2-like n=1 Tax=Venturia canescens TaxID=32260 RepID=UPI001C9C2673|nr:pancreatic lipase-related protein 2-like [Venturia canescens]